MGYSNSCSNDTAGRLQIFVHWYKPHIILSGALPQAEKPEALIRSRGLRPVASDAVIPAPQARSINLVGGSAAESRTRIPCQGHCER